MTFLTGKRLIEACGFLTVTNPLKMSIKRQQPQESLLGELIFALIFSILCTIAIYMLNSYITTNYHV